MNTVKPFKLLNQDEKECLIPDPNHEFTLLFFYPKDNTPGCSLETKNFSKLQNQFRQLNCAVYGISGLSPKSKKNFLKKLDACVALLADENFEVSKMFNVYKKKKFMGKEYYGIVRTTFILDKSGRILNRFDVGDIESHPQECLEFLKSFRS